jgi:hypothetical protein
VSEGIQLVGEVTVGGAESSDGDRAELREDGTQPGGGVRSF